MGLAEPFAATVSMGRLVPRVARLRLSPKVVTLDSGMRGSEVLPGASLRPRGHWGRLDVLPKAGRRRRLQVFGESDPGRMLKPGWVVLDRPMIGPIAAASLLVSLFTGGGPYRELLVERRTARADLLRLAEQYDVPVG